MKGLLFKLGKRFKNVKKRTLTYRRSYQEEPPFDPE